jgi:hypothetical protein
MVTITVTSGVRVRTRFNNRAASNLAQRAMLDTPLFVPVRTCSCIPAVTTVRRQLDDDERSSVFCNDLLFAL